MTNEVQTPKTFEECQALYDRGCKELGHYRYQIAVFEQEIESRIQGLMEVNRMAREFKEKAPHNDLPLKEASVASTQDVVGEEI